MDGDQYQRNEKLLREKRVDVMSDENVGVSFTSLQWRELMNLRDTLLRRNPSMVNDIGSRASYLRYLIGIGAQLLLEREKLENENGN